MLKKFLCLTVLFAVGCATQAPVPFSTSKEEGQWEAKAQVRDLEKGTSNTVSLDVMSLRNRDLRMEVTGTLGVHVASFLLKGNEIAYAVHPQKKYYSGIATERSLRPLLKIDIDPRWLYAIFFDEPLNGWKCEGQPVEKCQRSDGTQVVWSDRNGERKRVTISNPQFELQILVKNFMTKVQSPEKAFNLETPESYRRYKLL
jgi:hypothetical protein